MAKKIPIMDPAAGYDLAAGNYDQKESYLDSFEKGQILPLLGDIKDLKVLDVGAGTGRLSGRLFEAGAEVTALDVSAAMLKILSRKFRKIATVVGEAESLPFSEESFDLVVAAFLVVHLKDPTRFFDEAYRVLKNGGRLLVTNINQKEPPEVKTKEGIVKIESYYHRPEKIREILGELAFEIEQEAIVKERDSWINQILVCRK